MVRTLTGRALELVTAVHEHPGLSRADAGRRLSIGSGAVTELVARLGEAELLGEQPGAPTGGRGRPTHLLGAHPAGPLVAAVAIGQEGWRLEVQELGGLVVRTAAGDYAGPPGDAASTLRALSDELRRLRRRYPARLRGLGISVPGTVAGSSVLQAANLGWQDVDLAAVWPRAPLLVVDNDATLAAVAESRRGGGGEAALGLHLWVEAGLGGAVVEAGRVLRGARGVAGEFGHMPFGDPAVRCPCGAHGCWGTEVDGSALARYLGRREPRDPVSFARGLLTRAGRTGPAAAQLATAQPAAELAAAERAARALGRGIAGLVNGLDADLVTVGGLGGLLLRVAGPALHEAYHAGLMSSLREQAAPIREAVLDDRAPLIGAAEQTWSALLPTLTR